MVSISAQSAFGVNGRSKWGKVGSPIIGSRYVRDYCFLCFEPIRVPKDRLGKPNSCSFCQTAYRGYQGIAEAERIFWIRNTFDKTEVINCRE